MNYQYPYKNQYGSGRSTKPMAPRIARQLAIVLCMILVVVMFKFVKTGPSETINSKISDIIGLDYTSKVMELINEKTSVLDGYLNKRLEGISTDNTFKLEKLPVDGKITSGFGNRTNPITKKAEHHDGIDLSVKTGTDVMLVFSGVVEKVEDNKSMGLTLTISHNNGYQTVYGHLSEVMVNAGEDVSSGSVIAKSGNTGMSTGPHLHFEVRKETVPVNPEELLKK